MPPYRTRLVSILALSGVLAISPSATTPAFAAGCVRFVASNFDAPGDDNQPANLNGEWVRIKNVCDSSKNIGGWKIHDYEKIHIYKFQSSFRIGARRTFTLYSGVGDNIRGKRYWQRTYGAV